MSARERPILMSAPMVRALLDGSKTQTRRALRPDRQPLAHYEPLRAEQRGDGWMFLAHTDRPSYSFALGSAFPCPYGAPGDHLWVKETIRLMPDQEPDDGTGRVLSCYAADGELTVADAWPWQRKQLNSIHCPRGLSRITLEVTGVRVERLQDISELDAIAEGIELSHIDSLKRRQWRMYPHQRGEEHSTYVGSPFNSRPVESYASLWLNINGPASWDSNPWVWVVEFRRL